MKLITKYFYCILIAILLMLSTTTAQETQFREQSWHYGLTGALQYNSVSLGWQSLHGNDDNFHSPENDIELIDGNGWGAYGGLFGAYLSESWWGIQFRICYDERRALIEDLSVKKNDPMLPTPSFDTRMSYLSFAPSFRIDQHIIPDLYFHVGFFINANLKGTYIYKPDITKTAVEPEADVTNRNIATYGLQGGFGYDFKLAEIDHNNSVIVSPIIDASWLVNQRKSMGLPYQNSVGDIWSTMSFRIGIIVSIANTPDDKISTADKFDYYENNTDLAIIAEKKEKVSLEMPEKNIITTKNVKGYFPIEPYVFFDKNSQNIPPRYTMLTETEAKNFKESDIESFMKGDLTTKETNVNQLMKTYYNIMNIYGDRMRNNPEVRLTLRGTDPEEKEGERSANMVKDYLVNIYGIDPDRITIIVAPPYNPSGSEYTEASAKRLIDDENRRVKFLFSDQKMTIPVSYTIRDESSIDNDMVFTIDKNVKFKSWDITITGEGKTMYFGPFAYRYERINPAEMMRFLESGEYNAKVEITDNNNVKTEENYSFNLSKEKEIRNASRYLMIFNYNETDAVRSYEQKIRTEIVPGLIAGDKVIVHGHTDNIGTSVGNRLLSQKRADETKAIIDDQLKKENVKVNVKAIGIGQTKMQYTFNNAYPEGRMYNRNVFVEIIK